MKKILLTLLLLTTSAFGAAQYDAVVVPHGVDPATYFSSGIIINGTNVTGAVVWTNSSGSVGMTPTFTSVTASNGVFTNVTVSTINSTNFSGNAYNLTNIPEAIPCSTLYGEAGFVQGSLYGANWNAPMSDVNAIISKGQVNRIIDKLAGDKLVEQKKA